jgi:hypothetical protein
MRIRPRRMSIASTKLAAIALTALLAMAAFSAVAQACSYPEGKTTFSRWGDLHSYVLAPNGGFEAGDTGWSLQGGAKVVQGNESFYLNSSSDSHSLSLPAGSRATSPPICMALETPIFRFLARNGGEPTSKLSVEAVYSVDGLLQTKVLNTVTAPSSWSATQEMSTVLTLSTVLGTLTPSSIQVQITPLDVNGKWRIDDLYVDPFARH